MSSMKSFACWNSFGIMLPEESRRKAMSMMLSHASISRKNVHNRMSFVFSWGGGGVYTVTITLGETEQYQEWKYRETRHACTYTSQLH